MRVCVGVLEREKIKENERREREMPRFRGTLLLAGFEGSLSRSISLVSRSYLLQRRAFDLSATSSNPGKAYSFWGLLA